MSSLLTATRIGNDVVRALLVEDNDGDARLVQLMLQGSFGHQIEMTRARSLREALVQIESTTLDCVILDLGLPDAHGLEAVLSIKAQAPLMAIVVLTGQADGELGTAAVAAGAQDYLVKGNTIDESLTRSIRYAVVRKNGEDALVRSQHALAEAQRVARVGSWELELETGTMTWSDELCRLYEHPTAPAPTFADLIRRFHPEDRDVLEDLFRSAVGARSPFAVDHRIVLPDGTERWIRSQGRVEQSGAQQPLWMHGTAQDITEQKVAEDALEHQALHDPLTGLPNRALLLDRLALALAKLDRKPGSVGMLFVDVDRFKVVNDSLGHAVGDEILLAMAGRLQSVLRPDDTLARFGGDEFVVLCEDIQGEVDALGMADRINQSMVQPLSWGAGELVMTVSTGIALASSSSVSPESLLRDADAAMYRAKEGGRARSAVFAHAMRTSAIGRLDTEVSLRRAITDGELETHYQPIFELPTRTLVGFEALVRWRHPTRSLVGPDHFITIAEETGLIVPLGIGVLAEAAAQAVRWQQRPGCSGLRMAVNLSAAQLSHPDLVASVASILDTTGLAPHSLQLEITETALMQDETGAAETMRALHGLGVGLSIDDFGIGYSSLSRLKRFPVDVLKIDRSFVAGLGDDPGDSAIVCAIVDLAHALDLTTIAEGIETELQVQHLVELGCHTAQGYHLARPAPADRLDTVIDQHSASQR